MSKILKEWTLWLFENPVCYKMSKKIEGGPFGDKKTFEKKSHSAEKN